MNKTALYGGLAVVVATHVAMVYDKIPMSTMLDKQMHAWANLGAAAAIMYGISV